MSPPHQILDTDSEEEAALTCWVKRIVVRHFKSWQVKILVASVNWLCCIYGVASIAQSGYASFSMVIPGLLAPEYIHRIIKIHHLSFVKSVLIWHNLGVMWWERPIIWPLSLSVALSLSVQEGVLTSSRLWDSLRGLEGKWWPSDVLETYKCPWAWMKVGTRSPLTSISGPVLHFDSPGRGGARGRWGLLGVQIHQTGWERAAIP